MAMQTTSISDLCGVIAGAYVISTSDGCRFLVDIDECVTVRLGASDEVLIGRGQARSDRLLVVATCRIGEPMVLLVDRGVSNVEFTRRETASVTRIARLLRPPQFDRRDA